MANLLDENGPVAENGRDVNVIAKQLPVTCGTSEKIAQFGIVAIGILPLAAGIILIASANGATGMIVGGVILALFCVLPAIILWAQKKKIDAYFRQLEQKLQHSASTIDNYLENRVQILQNCAKLLDKAIDLDKDTFTKIAALRSGNGFKDDESRNTCQETVDTISRKINVAFENYPDLKSHQEIADCMQQNSYLQREITAAREVYNDNVLSWNREINEFLLKKVVAAKNGYTTRIPFAASKETKEQARSVFF